METLESIIGDNAVLRLSFESSFLQGGAQSWTATLANRPHSDHGPSSDEDQIEEQEVAHAVVVRVSFDDADWWDSLDAETSDLAVVGEPFRDLEKIAQLDPDALFAQSLVVLDFVSVPEQHRGDRVSHRLARGIAHVFRSDIVALTPDGNTLSGAGRIVEDRRKRAALVKHWKRAGFITVPGTPVMMLPLSNR